MAEQGTHTLVSSGRLAAKVTETFEKELAIPSLLEIVDQSKLSTLKATVVMKTIETFTKATQDYSLMVFENFFLSWDTDSQEI